MPLITADDCKSGTRISPPSGCGHQQDFNLQRGRTDNFFRKVPQSFFPANSRAGSVTTAHRGRCENCPWVKSNCVLVKRLGVFRYCFCSRASPSLVFQIDPNDAAGSRVFSGGLKPESVCNVPQNTTSRLLFWRAEPLGGPVVSPSRVIERKLSARCRPPFTANYH